MTATDPSRPPLADVDALAATLEEYGASIDVALGALEHDRCGLAGLLREVRNGGDISAFVVAATATGNRSMLTDAITKLEERRRVVRVRLFRALLAQGLSIGDIARTWGISRQLASRILREANDANDVIDVNDASDVIDATDEAETRA